MTKSEQRVIVATGIMKWVEMDNRYPRCYWEKFPNGSVRTDTDMLVDDYHPDLKDDRSLGQASRLLELITASDDFGLRVFFWWRELECDWACRIEGYRAAADRIHTKYVNITCEGTRWNAALLQAASKLAEEMKNEACLCGQNETGS